MRFAWVCACVVWGIGSAASAQSAPAVEQPFHTDTVHSFSLDNGLRLLVQVDRTRPRVGIALSYATGTVDDPDGFQGMAHLAEHALFEATQQWISGDCWHALRQLGATEVQGRTELAHTVFELEVPRTALERALWVEAKRQQWVLEDLDEAAVERAVASVVDERRDRWAHFVMWPRFFRALYGPGHPWAKLDAARVDHIELEELRWFIQRHYTPSNATLALVGDVDPARVKELVVRHFGHWKGYPRASRVSASVAAPLTQTHVVEYPANVFRRHLLVGWRLPPGHSDVQVTLDVLREPLTRALERNGLSVAGIGAVLAGPELPATFVVRAVLPLEMELDEGAERFDLALREACSERADPLYEEARYALLAAHADARTQTLLSRDRFVRRAALLATAPEPGWLHDQKALDGFYTTLDDAALRKVCGAWLLGRPRTELRVREKQGFER